MSRLEEIKNLLPDNSQGLITEAKLREAFSKIFEEMNNLPRSLNSSTRNVFRGKLHLSGNDRQGSDNTQQGFIRVNKEQWNAYSWLHFTEDKKGKVLSMSLKVRAIRGLKYQVKFYADHHNNLKISEAMTGTGEWQTVKVENITAQESFQVKNALVGIDGKGGTGTLEYKDLMVVFGAVAPDSWTPAPEDLLSVDFFKNIPEVTGNAAYTKMLVMDNLGNIGWVNKP